MKLKSLIYIALLGSFSASMSSCTKLNEEFRSELEEAESGNVDPAALLINAYSSLNVPYQQEQRWVMQEISTDAAMAPTRGGDWDDNGMHRAIHLHTWNADNGYMNNTFVSLGTAMYNAINVLRFSPSAQQEAEARFIRALTMFDLLDLYGVVPIREGESLEDFRIPPEVLQPQQAIDYMVNDLRAIIDSLPAEGAAYVANQNAARTLLMKIYLNKGTFINRESPTFPVEDMNQVIALAGQITASGRYSVSPAGRYFDNFAPDNDVRSTENIFTLFNRNGERGGAIDRTWFTIAHYNMRPSGWNGWCTLSDYYDKFSESDERRGIYYDYPADTTGNRRRGYRRQNVGFFVGQQYNWSTNQPLMARNPANAPLSFTREVTIRTSGATLEVAGIRPVKYAFDYAVTGQRNNDWVVFRYADVLLMQAEAALRGGTGSAADALTLVNSIRTNRGVPAMTSLTLDNLLDERARELYWEGWRRQDLIRFGKFLEPWQEKEADPSPRTLVYPIPSQQIAVNPNLTQNPGY
ncbi:RagB/SusD family nutrient uptake outer membrane protein [Sphingobacterium paludis]|uniref:SusD-like starch-binding protein associating with outer membrane n=1 Tax=Sphingobacterium paludis TaxID=1476465 RepID=A0A4R7CYY8_9SPHI|nr:RagB/SusD family nutrient uptake outer membrane protein [Sphingobacterium paludis]TDS12374.1 SusD-like starch-binding protein associating with outer membrane [Sphingobacterium paludis]